MPFRPRAASLPLLLLALLAVLAGCGPCYTGGSCADPAPAAPVAPAAPPVATPAPPPGGWNLTLFHVNDMHTNFLPEPATWRDDRALVGGLAALQSCLIEERAASTASLTLDAGDFMTGNPVGEIEADGVLGGGWIEMLNELGLDAGVIGNHDFDLGRANLHAIRGLADWPLMALDLRDEDGELEFPGGPYVFERGGLRIGVIGVTCAGLEDVVADARIEGLHLEDQTKVVRRWVADLDPRTDLIVLITHNGLHGDLALARELEGSGLDVIVGGHSHTRLEEPRLEGGILVVQAGAYAKNLGRLDLRVEDDRVVAYAGRLIPLLAAGREAGPELKRLIDGYAARIDAEYGAVAGRLASAWERDSRRESNVGDWICECLRRAAGADVALLNSGTLRKDYAAGPVTYLQLHQLMPFGNLLVTFEIDGRGLEEVCLANARAAESGEHGILQVAGLRYAYAVADGEVELLEAEVGGQPIESDRVYTVACPDYVTMKARLYMDRDVPATRSAGVTITEALVAAFEEAGTIDARIDGRIARR